MPQLKCLAPLALLLLPSLVWAQSQPAQTFRDTTSVVVIEVPVNVVRDGESVRGLSAENFRVFDGKKEQQLAGFEVIDLEVAPATAPAMVPPPARRRFLLFFDLAFTPRADIVRSIAAARQLLTGLHSSDVVALAAYTQNRGAELLQNFSTDRRQTSAVLDGLAAVLDGQTPRASQSSGRDPLRLVVKEGAALALDVTTGDISGEEAAEMAGGSRGSAGIAEVLRSRSEVNLQRNKDRTISLFKGFTDALSQFAAATAGLDGRRFFVFFSRGFNADIFADNASRTGAVASGGANARSFLTKAIEEFRRTGWEIHSVDPGRASFGPSNDVEATSAGAGGGELLGVDSLLSFAKDTGGTLYRNFGDLGSAMGQMLDRTAVTYLLAFQVENVRQDGAYHPIKVELRNVAGGAKVFHRSGFFAPRPDQLGVAKAVSTAERILSAEETKELPLRSLLVPLRGPEGKVRVAAILETDGAALLAGHGGNSLGVEVYAYAIDDKGDIEDFFAQQLTLDAAKVAAALASKNFEMFADLSLPPGRYRLRVLLKERDSGRQTLTTLPLEIADLAAPGPQLAALLMVSEGNDPVLIREKAGATTVPYPFVVGEAQEFFPALAPTLSGPGQRRLALFGYGLRGGGFALGIELKNAAGETLEGKLKLVGAAPTQPDGLDRPYLLLDPQGLEPGDYRIEAGISDTAGKVISTTATSLKVVAAP